MKGDRITISSQNTRCLGQGFPGSRKRKEIKDIFKHTIPSTDILLLQELKISEQACLKQARLIEFRGGTSLWNEATFSARTARYTGGTGIILAERLASLVIQHGVLYPGRAQFVTLQLSPHLKLGILNVYGFSETGPRAVLWSHLAQVELPEAEWILAGDFNNIEQASDKQGGSPQTRINRRELEAWNRLLMRLGVRDSFHLRAFLKRSDKAFTWSNARQDNTMVQSRIDRIYVPNRIEYIGGTLEILPTLQDVSDHAGVVVHFSDEGKRTHHPPPFNKGLLATPENKAALLNSWRAAISDPQHTTWNNRVVATNKAVRQASVELTKAQKKKWKEVYLSQFDAINAAEAELQRNWGSREAREKLSDAQAILHEVRQQKFQFQESAILSKWARVGDRCTKEFFEHHSGHKKPTPITKIHEGDRILTQQSEIVHHILRFYEALYTRDEVVEANQAAREDCFSYLKLTVTDAHNTELLLPITPDEVSTAMKQLPAGKAPGEDAIPAEFYHELWEDISSDIFNFVSESVQQAHITEELNVSKIALLPKSEDRVRIQNYRPISLLNTLYKVVAKVYANRMKKLLHFWILPSQTGFVPNRCILDNVFLAFEAVEWALENNQELSMLLLDFEKAYDRVSWTFLSQATERMGFHSTWIAQVMSLNLNASASIIINGEISTPFKLQRSVRQGCPLAPYLFLLTVDVLGQMLQHPDCRVEGLRLPDNSAITNQMFADDTLLLLDGTPENLDRAINVIARFGAASGAKLNLHKSIGLWIAHTERPWQWGEAEGLKWLQPGEVTRYLGYPFGLRIPQQEKDSKMLGQIRKHLHKWASNKLSLAGRIMVSNQVILSSIWYLASCTDLSGHALKLARATVRNYIWSGKEVSCARARVKWATAVLPIVRGGVKILDPQWQASALLVKLLIRGLTTGYEPWKVLVRHRVAQTKQSRRGRWPSNANWIMNSANLVKQGSTMWQGVMRAWRTIQSGLEQQDPTSWSEITRQPIFGNRYLTSEEGIQWGTTPRSNMLWWAERGYKMLQDFTTPNGLRWSTFRELPRLKHTRLATQLYDRVINSIPWAPSPMPAPTIGQWVAPKDDDGSVRRVYHIKTVAPTTASLYHKDSSERLQPISHNHNLPPDSREIRIVRTVGPRHIILDYNPVSEIEDDQSLWVWGNEWVSRLEWDPKEWLWRRIGILPESNILNYTTKRGYRVAMRQENHQMPIDAELEAEGYDSKMRAKFFNRIWHPHLPRKVSAMQWLILTKGLPVGAWRERIGLASACQICPTQDRETLQHSFLECTEVSQAWRLFRNTRLVAGLTTGYTSWKEISRGRMTDPPGPRIEEDLRWDTAASFTLTAETPWDILRAQLLWSIWCHRVAHSFSEDQFHLGAVLWKAWKSTIYCAMEAHKELFRHKRNEEKRQEMINCFEQIWTAHSIFGRASNPGIKWNTTPHQEFLPRELAAWITPPIRIHRSSPSPDPDAAFVAQPNFAARVHDFVQDIANDWRPSDHPVNPPLSPQPSQEDVGNENRQQNYDPSTDYSPPQSPRGRIQVHTVLPLTIWQHENLPAMQAEPPSEPSWFQSQGETRAHSARQSHNSERNPPIRRPKTKCCFGPRRNRGHLLHTPLSDPSQTISIPHSPEPPSREEKELEALLREIDAARDPTANRVPSPTKIKSRGKQKCTFGPRRRTEPVRNDAEEASSSDRHPAPTHQQEVQRVVRPTQASVVQAPESWPDASSQRQRVRTSNNRPIFPAPPTSATGGFSRYDLNNLSPDNPFLITDHLGITRIGLDRVTFYHPSYPRGGPALTRYYASAMELPRPNPNRFALARLGISEAELEARVAREVDEALTTLSAERRLANIFSYDFPRILSKVDCLVLFEATGVPTSGSLLGVYHWATDTPTSVDLSEIDAML